MSNYVTYSFNGPIKENFNPVTKTGRQLTFTYPCKTADECEPFEVNFRPGYYRIECWGSGFHLIRNHDGRSYDINVYGAYTKGSINFVKEQKLYFYIGTTTGKFNSLRPEASTQHGWKPNGASDVRIENGDYYNFKSLKSRIMVAAGSGATDDLNGEFGHGGTLNGFNGIGNFSRTNGKPISSYFAPGGRQTKTNECTQKTCIPGDFGLASYNPDSSDNGAFGGSGYYAGSTSDVQGNGGGGSSFISGYFGCDAINESSEEGNIIHTGQSIHYSGLLFHDTQMKPGNETLHNTGGMIRVTVLFPNETCKTSVSIRFTYLFYLITLTQ